MWFRALRYLTQGFNLTFGVRLGSSSEGREASPQIRRALGRGSATRIRPAERASRLSCVGLRRVAEMVAIAHHGRVLHRIRNLEYKHMTEQPTKHSTWFTTLAIIVVMSVATASMPFLVAQEADFLSDRNAGIALQHQQQWGNFGFDTAAARTGGIGAPLQIGKKTYKRGLGHHANGEIVVDLRGQYSRFRTLVGVQWQGGKRGSVTFRVSVDGEVQFEAGPMSDSDPPKQVDVSVVNARELRLIATDSGDGIGCDMAKLG